MSRRRRRVLVIEDEAIISMYLVDALFAAGFEAIPAASGEEAMLRAVHLLPDAVVLDIVLLTRLSGVELLRQLRATVPRLPAVIASARSLSADERQSFDLAGGGPPVGVFQKPYSMEDLVADLMTRLAGATVSEAGANDHGA